MLEPVTTKVAIACQGGGSQTAFTAGVLSRILRDPGLDRDFELVAMSGTSGGAICCALAWYGLLAGADGPGNKGDVAADLLGTFWQRNSAHDPWDMMVLNPFIVGMHRLVDAGVFPATAPPRGVPQQVRARLEGLLNGLIRFDDLPELLRAHPRHPTLMCGAVDVVTGEFAVFEEACPDPDWRRERWESHPETVSVKTLLASAAVPPLMPAIRIDKGVGHDPQFGEYWDGLFAPNPPIRHLVDRDYSMRPDEIWVIQIDPEEDPDVPTTPLDVMARRFELGSNLSMKAELHWIRQINQWIAEGVLSDRDFKPIEVARIQMSKPLAGRLDLASTVDRDPGLLRELMADGDQQVKAFLAERRDLKSEWWEPNLPHRYHPLVSSTWPVLR
jgi:NTE family protein